MIGVEVGKDVLLLGCIQAFPIGRECVNSNTRKGMARNAECEVRDVILKDRLAFFVSKLGECYLDKNTIYPFDQPLMSCCINHVI